MQSHDAWGKPRRVGFVKLAAEVSNERGERLDTAALLRGESVAMLVVLVPVDQDGSEQTTAKSVDDNDKYVVLTVQPRLSAGSLSFVELPAGMLDDSDSFSGAAAREISEELGLEINHDDLVCLTDLAASTIKNEGLADEGLPAAMFPSAGGCDECIRIFYLEHRVPRDQLNAWNGKLTGLRDEGERITLKLVRMRDLWREGMRDSKALSALALYEGLKREGKI